MKKFAFFDDLARGYCFIDELCLSSEKTIQASRVDQALCDQALAGRIHGSGHAAQGQWLLGDGLSKLSLHEAVPSMQLIQPTSGSFDYYRGSLPLIIESETYGMEILGRTRWPVQFPYLRASCGELLADNPEDELKVTEIEYLQAAQLGGRWGLTGYWGDKNRLESSHYSPWQNDDSILTTKGDKRAKTFYVADAEGILQYAVEKIQLPKGALYLPFCYLKRSGFWGSRRVFFPPGTNIAIWFAKKLSPQVKNIILTAEPQLLFHGGVPDDFAVGCLPGGKSSIAKTEIKTLQNRMVWLPLFGNSTARILTEQLEFQVKMAALLQHNSLSFQAIQIKFKQENKFLKLNELCALAQAHGVFVPEELRSEFLGDLTQAIANYIPTPIIDGTLNMGEAMLVQERELPPFLMAAHIAKKLNAGEYVFGSFWPVAKKYKTLTMIDREHASFAARYGIAGTIADCRFLEQPLTERMNVFRTLLADAQVVIIAASELICDHPATCLEVIYACLGKQIPVIILADADLPAKLQRMISKKVIASRVAGKSNLAIALADDEATSSIEAEFNAEGALLTVRLLSEEEREQIVPGKTVASHPPDIQKLLSAMQH